MPVKRVGGLVAEDVERAGLGTYVQYSSINKRHHRFERQFEGVITHKLKVS